MTEGLAGVDQYGYDVGLGEAGSDVLHHPHIHLVQRPVDSGRIEEGDLSPRVVEDADDPVARRLRFGGDDRDLVAEDAVQQRRLAGIRTADQRDHAEMRFAGGFGINHGTLSPLRLPASNPDPSKRARDKCVCGRRGRRRTGIHSSSRWRRPSECGRST